MSRFFLVALLLAGVVALVSGQSPYTGSSTLYPIPTGCANARGIAVDGSGYMYIACGRNSSVMVLDSNGGFSRNITMNGGNWSPFGIAFSGASMYVTSLYESVIYQITTATGAMVTSWTTSLNWPWGIAVDSSSNVWVANYGAGSVLKFSSSGALQQTLTTTSPAMYYPEEIVIDGSGNILVVDTDNNRVVKFNSAGQVVATFNNTTPALNEPGGIALDSQGNIYVCNTWNYSVIELNSAGQQIATISASQEGSGSVSISAAAGLTIANNQLYILDSLTDNRVIKVPIQNGATHATVSALSLLVTLAVAAFALLA